LIIVTELQGLYIILVILWVRSLLWVKSVHQTYFNLTIKYMMIYLYKKINKSQLINL